MDDKKPGPIHQQFARELVALCQKHGMTGLSASYYASFHSPGESEYRGRVTVTWSEGRHGAKGRIAVAFEGSASFDETGGYADE
jgi:hypothetical protein